MLHLETGVIRSFTKGFIYFKFSWGENSILFSFYFVFFIIVVLFIFPIIISITIVYFIISSVVYFSPKHE